jgi:tRNA-splicing ligase RtcB
MSYKYQVVKHSDNHFILPAIKDMKCEVHAFLSEELYQATEENVWNQIVFGASQEGVTGAYLMPDTHTGYGVPVGSVIVTDDVILQGGSGYDISCGIIHLKFPELHAKHVASKYKREKLVNEIEKRIATGVGSSRPSLMPVFNDKKVDEILRYGAKALGVSADICERQFIPVDESYDLRQIKIAYDKAKPQLGSVGSGNHFIEIQCDCVTGEVWAMIHCGSRGFGWQVANYFFFEGAKLRGLPKNRREESWLRADEEMGKHYWAMHNASANFAVANRHIIVSGVQEAFESVFNVCGDVYYEISHNLIQEETIILPDNTTKRGFVHRKGATRAFPAKHPDLKGTKWFDTGHPVLIPGSMFTGAAILFPDKNANKTCCSVNHGSGRVLARGTAKKKLEHRQDKIDNEMNNVKRVFDDVTIEGIVMNHKHTPLDECGHVYKDLDAVLKVLEDEKIAKVAHRLYPIANIKGAD